MQPILHFMSESVVLIKLLLLGISFIIGLPLLACLVRYHRLPLNDVFLLTAVLQELDTLVVKFNFTRR